jgi:hypothetical protein
MMNFNQNIVPTINLLNSSCIPTDVLMYMLEFSNDKNKLLSLDKKSYNKFSPLIYHKKKMKMLRYEITLKKLNSKFNKFYPHRFSHANEYNTLIMTECEEHIISLHRFWRENNSGYQFFTALMHSPKSEHPFMNDELRNMHREYINKYCPCIDKKNPYIRLGVCHQIKRVVVLIPHVL